MPEVHGVGPTQIRMWVISKDSPHEGTPRQRQIWSLVATKVSNVEGGGLPSLQPYEHREAECSVSQSDVQRGTIYGSIGTRSVDC